MSTVLGLLAVALVLTGMLWAAANRYKTKKRAAAKRQTISKEKDYQRRREAHYMQNFWSYDGSVQEEFEE